MDIKESKKTSINSLSNIQIPNHFPPKIAYIKILINLIILNKKGDKMLLIWRKNYWEQIGKKLEYGETYEKALELLIKSYTKIKYDVKTKAKLKYITSFNSLNKDKTKHFVEIKFLYKITDENENDIIDDSLLKTIDFKWASLEDVKKDKERLFFGIGLFLEKYNIKCIGDIEKISGN